MTKSPLKSKSKLRTIKDMFAYLELDFDHVLGDWLLNYRCRGSLVQEMPLPLDDYIFLIKGMFASAGHDLDECLEDWRYNYREKRVNKLRSEKFNSKQSEIWKRFESFSDEACGNNLIDHRSAI